MSIHRGYAAVSFGQVHYRYAGAGDKPVLVLLHQTPSTSEMYVDLMQELEKDFRLLAPDTPGMGLSDALLGEYSISALADGIAEFLDEIGIDQCFVFGHHTGASIAIELAASNPGIVQAVALSGPTLLSADLITKLRSMATTIPITDDGSHFETMWERIRGKDPAVSNSIVMRETINGLQLGDRYADAYNAVIEHDFTAAATALQCPTLLFAGSEDPLAGQLEAAHEKIPQGTIDSIDGARTFICETHTVEVAGLLRNFFPREAA